MGKNISPTAESRRPCMEINLLKRLEICLLDETVTSTLHSENVNYLIYSNHEKVNLRKI